MPFEWNDVVSRLPLKKKTNAISVEAILCDSGINTTKTHTLFHNLNHFYGKSFLEFTLIWQE